MQQATGGTPCPDQRPLSSAELAEAATAHDGVSQSELRPQETDRVGEAWGYGALSSGSLRLFDGLGSQQLSCSGGCKDLRVQRVHLKDDSQTVSVATDDPLSGESQDTITTISHVTRPSLLSRRYADENQVGDANQTLQRAPRTLPGSCGSAMCPAISVPKCHGERVSSAVDCPISEEVCLDCAFAQACNATQEHSARNKKVGGACEPSRDRAQGYTESLSTVGKEFSSETDDSPSVSDRDAANIAACHGVQLFTVDGIRVSDVSIVADDPISGNPDNIKQWWEELQLMHNADEVGDGHNAHPETSVPFESREAAVSIVADGPFLGGCTVAVAITRSV